MHLAKPRRQVKSRATLRALLQANSRVMRRALLQANSQAQARLLVQQPATPPFLELRRPRRTSCSCRRRRFLLRRGPRANVCEVLSHSHFSDQYRPLKNVIARRAAAIAPFSLDIVGDVVGPDLLSMAIDAAVCCVNVRALFEHSGLRTWINVRPLFVGFRIEMSDLPRGNDCEADPREGKRAEDSEEERSKAFHQ